MPFGMLSLTTDNVQNLLDLRAARLVQTFSRTANSGSITVAGFKIADGFIFRRWNGAPSLAFVDFKWNDATSTLSWTSTGGNPGFTVYFFLTAARYNSPASWGIFARNAAGEVVLAMDHPLMGRKSTFSRTFDRNMGGGLYGFLRAGALAVSGSEIAVVRLAASQWVCMDAPLTPDGAMGLISNQTTLTGAVLDVPDNLTAPSGHGMLVRDAAGRRLYSDNVVLGRVTAGMFRNVATAANISGGWTSDLAGNAVCLSGGGFYTNFDSARTVALTAQQVGTNTLRLSYRTVRPGSGPDGGGFVTYPDDAFALTARIA